MLSNGKVKQQPQQKLKHNNKDFEGSSLTEKEEGRTNLKRETDKSVGGRT